MKLNVLCESSMIRHIGFFVPLPTALAKQYAVKKEDQSRPHITVLYIGDTDAKDIDLIEKIGRKIIARHRPIEVFISGLAWFTSNNDGEIAHSMVEAKGLATVNEELWDALLRANIKVGHSYPEYLPHVTLAYTGKNRKYDGNIPEGSFKCNNIELWKSKGETIAKLKLAGKDAV